MNFKEQQNAGVSLIIGSLLMIVTMVLHPVGGDFDHLLSIVKVGMISHSLAILSTPFVALGFFGLTIQLKSESFLSYAGFSVVAFALVAAMLAAATNGLALMGFVKAYEGASQETIQSLKPVFLFMRKFNHAFDYIFMGGICLSMFLWSLAIVRTKQLAVWIGYLGIFISASAIILFLAGFELLQLTGFRAFVFGIVIWILVVGVYLSKKKK